MRHAFTLQFLFTRSRALCKSVIIFSLTVLGLSTQAQIPILSSVAKCGIEMELILPGTIDPNKIEETWQPIYQLNPGIYFDVEALKTKPYDSARNQRLAEAILEGPLNEAQGEILRLVHEDDFFPTHGLPKSSDGVISRAHLKVLSNELRQVFPGPQAHLLILSGLAGLH